MLNRLPTNVNDNLDEDPTGTKSLWDRGLLSGASQKTDCICVFHVGEAILSLQVTSFATFAIRLSLFPSVANTMNVLQAVIKSLSHTGLFLNHLLPKVLSSSVWLCWFSFFNTKYLAVKHKNIEFEIFDYR